MRRGEIFNLTWFDLDFDRGVMHVRKTKTKLNRVVPMNARVREVLNRQKRSSEFVFTSEKTGETKFRKSWSRFGQLAKTASDGAGCK